MAGVVAGAAVPELQVPSQPQQLLQMPGGIEQQQAFMAMAMAAAAGMAGTCSNVDPPAPPCYHPPAVDPAQVYTQLFTQYLQQACAYGADPVALATAAAAATAAARATYAPQLPPFQAAAPTMPQAAPTMPPLAGFPPAVAQASAPAATLGAPLPLGPHMISMTVEGMSYQYQLTDDDLLKVFSRYGVVTRIQVDAAGTTAHITYDQFGHAQAAINDLNGKVLNGLDGKLKLVYVNNPIQTPAPVQLPTMMPPPLPNFGYSAQAPVVPTPWPATTALPAHVVAPVAAHGTAPVLTMTPAPAQDLACFTTVSGGAAVEAPAANPPQVAAVADGVSNITASDSRSPPHVKGVRKYTCRFLIGIENDKEFQVVRRIIGQNGSNMKRIFRQTEAKLRLRGRGSGYFEGASQRESSEPLQLCISCTTPEGYKVAVSLAEELLEGIYAEYRTFCKERCKPELEQLRASSLAATRGHDEAGGGADLAALSPPRSTTAGDSSESPARSADLEAEEEDGDEEASAGGSGAVAAGGGGSGGAKKESGRKRGRRSRGGRSRGGAEGRSRGAKSSDVGEPPAKAPPVNEIEQYIDQRNEARRQCNFVEADRIRHQLHERGVALMDEPGARGKGTEVTTWRYWHE